MLLPTSLMMHTKQLVFSDLAFSKPKLYDSWGHTRGRKKHARWAYTWALTDNLFFCPILVKIPYVCTQWKTILPHHMETDLQTLRYCEGAALHNEWMKLLDWREHVPSSPKIHQCLCSRRQRYFSPESQTQLPLPLPKGRSMWRSHNHLRDGET